MTSGSDVRAELKSAIAESMARYHGTYGHSPKGLSATIVDAVNAFLESSGLVVMPSRLTAENGAKGAMIGEFRIEQTHICPECGIDADEDDCVDCEICHGDGEWTQESPVGWSMIKDIHEKAVEICGIRLSDGAS